MDLSFIKQTDIEKFKSSIIFTDDEIYILENIPRGKSRMEIAGELKISVPSVDRRIRKIKTKLTKAGFMPCFILKE